ncbi:mitochondrial ribosomal protein L47 [Arctopsyche grandis]|uniref:mitochondrial ribosomal protein L47 n=1 Tax=Arctopsyche grandis TaxID=121162 RepID=UPI00406D9554
MWAAVTGAALRLARICPIAAPARAYSSSAPSIQDKLMAFFDDKKTWGKPEQRVGRAWKTEELRIKSNTDLHKLWYILLKERNMLFTMEKEADRAWKPFPNPERVDKVQISMRNIEAVVKERNSAYHLLETGENGTRPAKNVTSQIGRRFHYRFSEHLIPKSLNKKWKENHIFYYRGRAVRKFLRLSREIEHNNERKFRNRQRNHVQSFLRNVPNVNLEALKKRYPDVDIEHQKQSDKSRGHYIPSEFKD